MIDTTDGANSIEVTARMWDTEGCTVNVPSCPPFLLSPVLSTFLSSVITIARVRPVSWLHRFLESGGKLAWYREDASIVGSTKR